jgi:hypothetical protein
MNVLTLLIFLVPLLYWLYREVRAELRMAQQVRQPPCCANCAHETTPAVIARGRCPECGALYMLAGVDAPYARLLKRKASASIYAPLLVSAILLSLLTGGIASLALTPARTPSADTDLYAIGGFCISFSLLCIVPIIMILLRRKRLLRDLRTQMLPPPNPSSPPSSSPPPS